MNNEKVTKTIIKGVKEIKRLVGVSYDKHEMPQLKYKTFLIESDKIIQEVDFNLIVRGIERSAMGLYFSIDTLNILDIEDDRNEEVKIISETIENGIKTIIVNKIIEAEEQKFNYDEIMLQYNLEFNRYWDSFIMEYNDNKPKMIEIQNWLDGGMTQEEIIIELRKNEPITYSFSEKDMRDFIRIMKQ